MKKTFIMLAVVAAFAPSAALCRSEVTVALTSETLVGAFSQELPGGKKETGLPAYEYLGVDAGIAENLTFHFYGWGRYDLGGFYEPASTADLSYAYVRYSDPKILNLDARVGRLHLFGTPSSLSVDGISASIDPLPWLGVSLWGGLPVDLNQIESSNGDAAYGASITGRLPGWAGATASYMKVENDANLAQELFSVDGYATPLTFLSLFARGVYNLDAQEWQSRSLTAPITFGEFTLTPNYSFVMYEAFFDTGARTGAPFANPFGTSISLVQSGEELTSAGVDLSYDPDSYTTLGLKYKTYSYKQRSDDATYYALVASRKFYGASAGLEIGRMDGGVKEDEYDLARFWTVVDYNILYLGGDLVYAKYGEKIYGSAGDDKSISVSLCGGIKLRGNGEKMKLTLTYASDPNFNEDLRALLSYEFAFSR